MLLLIKLLFICIVVHVLNNKDKIKITIVINNIVIIIKKIIGGKYATLLGDSALESSSRFFSKSDLLPLMHSIGCSCHFLSDSNKSYIILKVF